MIWNDYVGLSEWANVITCDSTYKRKNGVWIERNRDGSARRIQPNIADFQDGGQGLRVKENKKPQEAGKGKKTDSFLERKTSQGESFCTSDLEKGKIMNLYCFKPLFMVICSNMKLHKYMCLYVCTCIWVYGMYMP